MDHRGIIALGEYILKGNQINYEDSLRLTEVTTDDIPILAAFANKIRQQFTGNGVDMCGLVSARSGMCSEDCKFCSQSVYHSTDAPVYDLRSTEEITISAHKAEQQGAKRISIVTSGKGIDNEPNFQKIIKAIECIINETDLKVCANLGTLTLAQAHILAASGIKRYAHNLETSKNFYPKVCTTHSYEERLTTTQAAKAAGMELCTGGIIDMGETWHDRIELAFTLKELNVDSIPINILNPVKGTALENQEKLDPMEILQTFAIFRFILPTKILRYAGGRERNLGELVPLGFLSGINGMLIGNYLTTQGHDADKDIQTVNDLGLKILEN